MSVSQKAVHVGKTPEKLTNLILFFGQVFELWFQVACSPWTCESYNTAGKVLFSANSPENQADLQPLLYPLLPSLRKDGKKERETEEFGERSDRGGRGSLPRFARPIPFFRARREPVRRLSPTPCSFLIYWLFYWNFNVAPPTCSWLCCVIRRFHFLHFIITASGLKSKKKIN